MAYPLGAFVSGLLIKLIFEHKNKNFNLSDRRNIFLKVYLANLLSVMIIFFIGVCYLYVNINYIAGKEIKFSSACWAGFIIFLPGDVLKMIVASLITIRIKNVLNIIN